MKMVKWFFSILFSLLAIGFCVIYAYGLFTGKIPSRYETPVCTCVCPQPEKP